MSAISNQQRVGGRRQPFGFLNANTIPSAKGASAVVGSGGGTATAHHSTDRVKAESKKKFRGVLTCIVTRSKRGTKNERDARSESLPFEDDVPVLESPTKKARAVTTNEDSNISTIHASAQKQGHPESNEGCTACDVKHIFRQSPAVWDKEMEALLELKEANPVLDYEGDTFAKRDEGKMYPPTSSYNNLDGNVSGENIMWSNRLLESKDGFKIHIDPECR